MARWQNANCEVIKRASLRACMPIPVIVHLTSQFERAYKKLPQRIQQLATRKDQLFRGNPFHKQLRTHKLKGQLDGFWSYSINHAYRVLFRFISDREVLYYDIGTHEIYK